MASIYNTTTPDFPHEEYNLLLQLTVPGTTRKFRNRANLNRMDLIMGDDMYETRPSGIILPKILRKKLFLCEKEQEYKEERSVAKDNSSLNRNVKSDDVAADEITSSMKAEISDDSSKTLCAEMDRSETNTLLERVAKHTNTSNMTQLGFPNSAAYLVNEYLNNAENEADNIDEYLPDGYAVPQSYQNIDPSQTFTTTELEKRIADANAAMADIQKQLSRGEELYYQESDSHGNMYKGWDTFIDVKSEHLGLPNYEIGSSSRDAKEYKKSTENNNAPIRRMNNGLRWFSLSSSITEQTLGKSTGKKRFRRNLSSSISPLPSGRSSRLSMVDVKKESKSPTLSLVTAKSTSDNQTVESNRESMAIDVKKESVNDVELDTSTTDIQVQQEIDSQNEISKSVEPLIAAKELEQSSVKDLPRNISSLEKLEPGNQSFTRKRKIDSASPMKDEKDAEEEDNDAISRKGRPRKRKK